MDNIFYHFQGMAAKERKYISRSLRKYTWVGRRSFVALELLLIAFVLFTNFTSVESRYKLNSSCKGLALGARTGKHLSGATWIT